MSAPELATEAIIIDRTASGDSWLRLIALSAGYGLLHCMHRISRRAARITPPPDLFDESHLRLETRNQGRTWFVRESVPHRRRSGLGASYDGLKHACRFARVLAANPLPEESRAVVFALLQRALDTWESGVRADATYFKSLYLLARDEGYPVREEWWKQLTRDDRAVVDAVLKKPVATQSVEAADVGRFTAALEEYLKREHDFRFD